MLQIAVLIAVLLVGQLNFAQVEMSGSGAGSGDSEDSCTKPSSTTMPTTGEMEITNQVRCHLACIDKVSESLA